MSLASEIDDPSRIFGYIAVALSLSYKFPQIYHLYNTKDTRGISVLSQIVQATAYGFYIAHGIVIRDPPVILLGICSGLQSCVLIFQYYLYDGLKAAEEAGKVLVSLEDHEEDKEEEEEQVELGATTL